MNATIDLFNLSNLDESVTNPTDSIVQEDEECNKAIRESLLIEAYGDSLSEVLSENGVASSLISHEIISERTIVKLDKKAKLERARAQAILAIAKEKNDRDFKKLITIWKTRKLILAKLDKRFGAQADRRAKEQLQNMKMSTNKVAKKAAAKLS